MIKYCRLGLDQRIHTDQAAPEHVFAKAAERLVLALGPIVDRGRTRE
jgi:hypothetical protein